MATISFDEFIKQNGGSAKEVKVVGNETQSPDMTQTDTSGVISDVKGIGTDIADSYTKRRESVQAGKTAMEQGKQSGIETFYQTAGQGAGLVSDIFGSVIKGGIKALLPKSAETSIKNALTTATEPVANSEFVKSILEKYNSLDEKTKRNVDATLGLGSLAFDVATLGGGKKATEVGIKTGLEGATKIAKGISPAIETTGRVLKGTGEAAYGLTVPPTEATAKALLAYDAKQPTLLGRIKNIVSGESIGTKPITEANTAARQGLVGTEYQIGVQAKKASDGLWNEVIQPGLNSVKGKVNMTKFFDNVEKEIIKTTKEKVRKEALIEALQSIRDAYKNVGNVSLNTLQKYKEGWAKFIPEAAYKGKPIGTALKEVQNIAAGKARDIIYKNLGEEGKRAYLDYGNLKSIINAGIKSTTGDIAKQSITRDIWQTIMNKAVTPIATFGGKVLYKTGEGLEMYGKPGAKTVKDIIGK